MRFVQEIFALVVDGWMLFFDFSGCFMRFGRDCRFNN